MTEFSPLERQLLELKDVAEQLPALRSLLTQPPDAHRCRSCGGIFGELEYERHWTGVLWVRDLCCSRCAQKFINSTCQIACLTCRVIATRMQALKDTTGFLFEAGRFYHATSCPDCLQLSGGEQVRTNIVELEQHKSRTYANYR